MENNGQQEVRVHRTGKLIPIVMTDRRGRPVGRSTLQFSAGRKGPEEAGEYAFWTVMVGSQPAFTVRTIEGRTVEHRLNEYSSMGDWAVGVLEQQADAVMPAAADEIRRWVGSKGGDSPFAMWETLRAF